MLWGFIPLISLPGLVFTIGSNDMTSNILAEVLNGLTILPASVMVFWRRKLASWWLIADAVVIFYAVLRQVPSGRHDRWIAVMVIAVPLFLGCFGLFTEKLGWPPLLDRREAHRARPVPPPAV
jgi:hypothetical protein